MAFLPHHTTDRRVMARMPLVIFSTGILVLLLVIGGLYLYWNYSTDDEGADRTPRFEETGEEIETRGGEVEEVR